MNILIVTPLFPPDTATSAKYVKELATRLKANHFVTVLHFGRLPENIEEVRFVSISKKLSVLRRIGRMTLAIIKNMKQADVVLVQNGPSVELPTLLASFLHKKKIVYMISDHAACEKSCQSTLQNIVIQVLTKRAHARLAVETISALIPATQHPLEPVNDDTRTQYEAVWKSHLNYLESNYSI
jgi:hypothetical protein